MSKKDISAEEIEELEKTPLDQILKDAEEVELITPKKGRKSVMSLRLDPEILRELEIYARKIGEKPTVVARKFIEEGLHETGRRLSSDKLLDMAKLMIKAEKKELLEKQEEKVGKDSLKVSKAAGRKVRKSKKGKQNKTTGK